MITKEKIQTLADIYHVEVVDVETLHDGNRVGCMADYIKLKFRDEDTEYGVNVYLGNDYQIVNNKEYYIECKIKNALYSAL